jgi:hypothetical protein
MSGMCPPWETPSLISASEISQVENLTRELAEAVDIARRRGCSLLKARFMDGSRNSVGRLTRECGVISG